MNIIGISAFYHDSAAALIRDGAIVNAVQEERFSREKNDSSFPRQSVQWCLHDAGLTGKDVDFIAFYEKPFVKFERLIETYLTFAPRGFASFKTAMPEWISDKLFQKRLLLRELGVIDPDLANPQKLLFSEHHISHAASAFYPSPFANAAFLTMDGVGEWTTTSVGVGQGKDLVISKEIHFPHSLGLLYSAFTYYLGFKVNSDEYKVMGLAPYGTPKYSKLILDELIDLKPDGSFKLALEKFDYCTGLRMTNERFDELFGGAPRQSHEPLTQRHMDIAASIQAVTEETVLRLTRSLAAETGLTNLCLAGGVALNCVANGAILRDGRFNQIWIQPAAGDAGGALGAALAAYHLHQGQPRQVEAPDKMKGAYLGPQYTAEEIRLCLAQRGAVYRELDDDTLSEEVISALVDQKVVGWFQGRLEFGPRALGNRSILGDARAPALQRDLNLRIKYREGFRPFAPAVLREEVASYFEFDGDSRYMLLTAPVRHERRTALSDADNSLMGIDKLNVARSDIPAVTHVDYSARLQTVDAATNPLFHRLLSEMKQKTGCSVLVNTSFNVRDEPIVCSPKDAYDCFMATEMDVLVMGNAILRKEEQLPRIEGARSSGDGLVPDRVLATLKAPGAAEAKTIERVQGGFRCIETGQFFRDRDGVPSLLSGIADDASDEITRKIKAFYEENPFPSYEDLQDFADIANRGHNSKFTRDLLESIGRNKLILECGCGTGQLSHFLSLNNNSVLGIDLSISSLKLALDHKRRNNRPRSGFVQMNIFDLAIKDETFDVVISSGVLHSTKDAPRAFEAIIRKAKPGGIIIVGLYNWYARIPTGIRAKLVGLLGPNIDYVVRSRIRDRRKAEIWIKDAYYNPHETWHPIDEVLGWFDKNNIKYLNCVPEIIGTDAGANSDLFAETSRGSKAARVLTQIGWLGTIASEGALFMMIGRKAS